MPWRSLPIAWTRSSRSVVSEVYWASTSLQLFVGAQVDRAEPLALAAQPFQRLFDLVPDRAAALSGFDSASSATAAGSTSSISWISRAMSERRRLAPSKRSSARASSSRAWLAASKAARASRSASACLFSASCRRSAQPRRSASASCTSEIRASRFSANMLRRVVELGASGLRFGDAALQRGELVARAFLALLRGLLVGGQRLEAAVGEFGFADDRLLLGAQLGQRRALGRDVFAHGGEFGFQIGGRRERGERAFGFRLGGGGFVAVGGQAHLRFGQRRLARGVAVALAFGRFVRIARAGDVALALARRGRGLASRRWRRCAAPDRPLPLPCARLPPRSVRSAIRLRCRRDARARQDGGRRRSAHVPRSQNRPSATGRLPATPGAGRA